MYMKRQSAPTFDKTIIKAIIGLGNPGTKYYKTRHSIGFRVVDELCSRMLVSWHGTGNMASTQVRLTMDQYDISFLQVYLIKPLTFMNNSGQVIPFLQKKGIKAEEILVVHDELEKSFGYVGFKFGGSAKGHNGLRSIVDRIGKDFWRLRFGIGRPEDRDDVGDYVLAHFIPDEEKELVILIPQAVDQIFK